MGSDTCRSTPLLATAEEVSNLLGVSRARLYELIRMGLVPSVRLGRSIRVPLAGLEQLLQAGGTPRPHGEQNQTTTTGTGENGSER